MGWVRGEMLGQGSFGTVNLAKLKNINTDENRLMAVKSCGLSQFFSLKNEKTILDEFKDCPEIIKCYGDCYTVEEGEKLYNVLLEYASGGNLFDRMKDSIDHCFQENEIRRYTKAILRGLDRIHKDGYIHCDIKLQNILLNQDGEIKIADFGLAKKSEENEGKSRCELRGTPLYMSPEMVVGGKQGSPADIWAVGCLIVEMFIGAPVWKCSDLSKLLIKIGVEEMTPEIPAKLSEQGKDFIKCCFIKDPKKRWTAEMLLRHPYVAAAAEAKEIQIPSTSPRGGLDFSDWISKQSSFIFSITHLFLPELKPDSFSSFSSHREFNLYSSNTAAAKRLQKLVSGQKSSNWSFSDDWITIR